MFVMMSYARHNFKKSVCRDLKMFGIMSKYVMRTKGASLLQIVRHDVSKTPNIVMKSKICHYVKRFVMIN